MKRGDALTRARRVVIKIGSRLLASDATVFARLAADVGAIRKRERRVVLVSSGAIALGVKKLGLRARPKDMARLQAAAAAGQSLLMRAYEEAFGAERMRVAQVLLTHADLADRTRANNARVALGALLDLDVVPILNENDSVAVEEIKFGDNDALSSMVVPLVDADVLVLLSDVQGLLDGQGERVRVVTDIEAARALVHKSKSDVGTGGMASKLEAARRTTLAGAHMVIADARAPGILEAIFSGADVGTWFLPSSARLSAKKHWIAFTLRPRGAIVIDDGAAEAIGKRGKSLLAVGALGLRGLFGAGDAVSIVDVRGREVGRGLARSSAEEGLRMLSGERAKDDVLVHRDELVVWP